MSGEFSEGQSCIYLGSGNREGPLLCGESLEKFIPRPWHVVVNNVIGDFHGLLFIAWSWSDAVEGEPKIVVKRRNWSPADLPSLEEIGNCVRN